MSYSDHDFYMSLRAAYIQQAKALQQERAALLDIVANIERKLGIKKEEEPREYSRVDIFGIPPNGSP